MSTEWPTEDEVDNAMRVLRHDYRHTVVQYAENFISDVKRGNHECSDLGEAREALEQLIDGCSDVIYNNAARIVGFCSRYDWASEWEDMGNDKAPNVNQIAYLCLVGEVWEEVESELETYFEEKDAAEDDSGCD